jgi:hypothetical protein
MNQDDWKAEEEEFQRMGRRQDWEFPQATINVQLPIKTKLVIPDVLRNAVLEEVALEFDKLKNMGDTSQSFAAFVRNMKH